MITVFFGSAGFYGFQFVFCSRFDTWFFQIFWHTILKKQSPRKKNTSHPPRKKKQPKGKKNTNHFPKQKKKLTNNEHYMIADLSCFEPPEFWGPLFWVEEMMELRREAAVEVVWGVAQLVVGGARFLWWMKHNMNIYETPGFFIFFHKNPVVL